MKSITWSHLLPRLRKRASRISSVSSRSFPKKQGGSRDPKRLFSPSSTAFLIPPRRHADLNPPPTLSRPPRNVRRGLCTVLCYPRSPLPPFPFLSRATGFGPKELNLGGGHERPHSEGRRLEWVYFLHPTIKEEVTHTPPPSASGNTSPPPSGP